MADQLVSDAALHPHDEGLPGISDGSEDWNSAGLQMLLGQAVQSGSYVRSDSELTFTGHDGTNDQVDVTAGVAYIALAGETVDVQSGLGGSSPPAYDTTITANLMPAICVVVPTTQTNLDVQAGTLSQVWLAYDTDGTGPGGSAGDVYLRSDDTGSVTAPSHPSVELGSANPDNAGADTLANRFGSPTFADTTHDTVTSEEAVIGHIETISPSDGASSVSRSLSGYDQYRIMYGGRLKSAGDLQMRMNGDGGATGDYQYFDETGTRETGENQFLVFTDGSGSQSAAGIIRLLPTRTDTRTAILHDFGFANTGITGYGASGGRDGADMTAIEFLTDAGSGFNSGTEFEIYGINNV